MKKLIWSLLCIFFFISACDDDEPDDIIPLNLVQAAAADIQLQSSGVVGDIPLGRLFTFEFSAPVDKNQPNEILLIDETGSPVNISLDFINNNHSIVVSIVEGLKNNHEYEFRLENIFGLDGGQLSGLTFGFRTIPVELSIVSFRINGEERLGSDLLRNVDTSFELDIEFSENINTGVLLDNLSLNGSTGFVSESDNTNQTTISLSWPNRLEDLTKYKLVISDEFTTAIGSPFDGYEVEFYTEVDSTLKFPLISDDELLTRVQRQTFRYFWDFGHPVSGLARERNTSNETVTIGGSGFGVMAIIVAIERGFITKEEGIDRLETIVKFLDTQAERFHGVWSHWLNGTTGEVRPFSANDDGADLVETAFMIQALITLRQYLDSGVPQEAEMITTINNLWRDVEWDWFTQGGQNVLYWHWSPNFEWAINLPISGWNESLMVYLLAASSPTHTIDKEVYEQGWARNGGMVNTSGNRHFGFELPLRGDRGGPLFFSHYSFLGLDPRNLEDQYANYWEQNVTHSLLNQAYCAANPNNYLLYSESCWGLTASDGNQGYSAHSPDNDRGVITPTAALSSFPYTPNESMEALKFFYYIMGDRLWGEYGFYDAFNPTVGWYANSYLAIDQGPIICMIENYRSGLLWDLFMSAPEIQEGLQKLEFTY